MDIHQIRRRNLRLLIEEHSHGNLKRFVSVTLQGLTSYKTLQHVTGPRAARNLGTGLARKIEKQLQLEQGWIDQDRFCPAPLATVPNGRSERAQRLAELVDALPPELALLVEQVVMSFAKLLARK